MAGNSITPYIDESTVELGLQFGASAGLLLLMVVMHSLGLLLISNTLHINQEELKERHFNLRSIVLFGEMGLMLFVLHIIEIFVFAAFYLLVGGMQTLEEAVFYSASAYATLGWTAEYFPQEWRLIGALEALIGFFLIGWSTAFMVTTMNRLRD